MPVLAVSYSGLLGGAERLLLDVAGGLPEPPLLACPPGRLAEAGRGRGLGVFELRERSLELRRRARDRVAAPARIAAQAAEVRALLGSARPDALVAWNMRAGMSCAAAAPRVPLMLQHNDLLPGPLVARAVRAAAWRADTVVAVSHCVARDLDPGGRLAGRMRVIHPGVDLERFRPRPGDAPTEPEVLVLGAIEPWKHPELALEAVALAAADLPGLRLRVAGEPIGPAGERLLEGLRERATRPDLQGRVSFEGRVEDPPAALAAASCLLHCAEREPYGLVVAEALAAGLPVVAPAAFGPAEIVEPACGRLYAPGDAAAAARGLVEALRNPGQRERMGAAARAVAERKLGAEGMRAQYAETLDALVATRRAGARGRGGPPPGGAARPGPAPLPGADAAAQPAAALPGVGVAVVTVLHDSEPELRALLASLERHLPGARVVVVDSGSTDGGAAFARGWRTGAAEVLVLGENAGFGRAVNEGLSLVEEPVTALLNPDVELLDASLDAAAREARRAPERLLAPLVLRPDGTREDNAQREPGSASLLGHALLPGAALPSPLAAAIEPWRSKGPARAGWAVGSCVVARTETLRRLGPFDERAFMYAEDLDLGLRAADAGVETWFWPAGRVVHSGAHSTRRAFGGEPFELLASRRREVVRERRGPRRARADDLLQLLTFADRLVLKRLSGREAGRERRQLAVLLELMRR
jgi:N-acetylglucosaminyl-diphospho-decaprenol L-rhamnosyltransferase